MPSKLSAWLARVASVALGRRPAIDVDHLQRMQEAEALGPVQRSEALLLFAITQVLQPRVIVEFGFNNGDSAANFLAASGPETIVHSYDNWDHARAVAAERFGGLSRFKFHFKSQTDFDAADIDHQPVDLVFIDASHDAELNQQTWRRLVPSLAPGAMVLVHDTGTWHRSRLLDLHHSFIGTYEPLGMGAWLNDDEYQHQLGERRFINWVLENSPEFSVAHFHSHHVLRHGLSILQRAGKLDVGAPGRSVRAA